VFPNKLYFMFLILKLFRDTGFVLHVEKLVTRIM